MCKERREEAYIKHEDFYSLVSDETKHRAWIYQSWSVTFPPLFATAANAQSKRGRQKSRPPQVENNLSKETRQQLQAIVCAHF